MCIVYLVYVSIPKAYYCTAKKYEYLLSKQSEDSLAIFLDIS